MHRVGIMLCLPVAGVFWKPRRAAIQRVSLGCIQLLEKRSCTFIDYRIAVYCSTKGTLFVKVNTVFR
jgi:hypothetical protein